MINNFYLEDFYAFSSDVARACTYGSDDNDDEEFLKIDGDNPRDWQRF
jgi:hypothetical protein